MLSVNSFFSSTPLVFTSASLLRFILLLYGVYQDANSALKYTDIDYYVFTDAARSVFFGRSPYDRATYRYTPLLSWLLLPTAWSGKNGLWFHSGKALFALSDLVAGWLILLLLRRRGMDNVRALKYASVWLLNPMVANISTRGSSEGLLCVLVMANLWAFETRKIALSGFLLGFSVHLKIYPFIYGASMLWALRTPFKSTTSMSSIQKVNSFLNRDRLVLLTTSLTTFTLLNTAMYRTYGLPFLKHTSIMLHV
jgi:phosphatidylinositol glycan class M